ncbi:MAG: hypothetical protein B6I18_08435 [Bacteroidetes bacterium 4572_112]|nr:MAG: hypothetical protein B6I18_08435 [Bacteroidetes bacterium 4572_112]
MKKIVILISLIIFSINCAFAQVIAPETTIGDPTLAPMHEKETVEYLYRFFPGDTLYYSGYHRDSVIYNYQPALTKERNETLKIWCDSISLLPSPADTIFSPSNPQIIEDIYFDTTKLMHMKVELVKFDSKEKVLNSREIVERTTAPWVNNVVGFLMDSTGLRYSIYSESTDIISGTSGPFAPELFPKVGSGIRLENDTWLQKDTIYIIENAMPAPIVYSATLMRSQNNIDTLDHKCLSFRYARTAQGTYYVDMPELFIHVTSVINCGYQMRLDQEDYIPVHFMGTSEQKLSMHKKGETDIEDATPAWHFLTNDYTLSKFIPSPERIQFNDLQKIMKETLNKEIEDETFQKTK